MTRVALAYPKILGSKDAPLDAKRCIAFEKYDGTNLHWVWERELSWYAFGTRRDRFDLDPVGIAQFNVAHPGLEDAPGLFQSLFANELDRIFQAKSISEEMTVFTEFLGPNSFAGMHKKEDPKQLILFDVARDGQILEPDQFVQDFGHLPIARVVYKGKLTGRFTEDVRLGKFGVNEGVVAKGSGWMVKIKTNAYMERLKAAFGKNWENYWE
jgi:hypothetical protein